MIQKSRPRRLRHSASIRSMVEETQLSVSDIIAPIFIVEGENIEKHIDAIPGYYKRSLDLTVKEVKEIFDLGIKSVLLFAQCEEDLKDNVGTEALNADGLMQRSIRAIKEAVPEICVMTDVALDPYSSMGHDGIVENEQIVNDPSVEVLAKMALSHAEAGADFVAPSDMMDGRILAMRNMLEENDFHHVGILSYSAKYASCFYGPFRFALDSAPAFGDKKTYQMNPANRIEAQKEINLDVEEGADIIMVKPALSYLDIIREAKNSIKVPICAYHVSGEYAMIMAAAEKGWLDEEEAMLETTLSIKRAGADLIVTYFCKKIAAYLNQ